MSLVKFGSKRTRVKPSEMLFLQMLTVDMQPFASICMSCDGRVEGLQCFKHMAPCKAFAALTWSGLMAVVLHVNPLSKPVTDTDSGEVGTAQ